MELLGTLYRISEFWNASKYILDSSGEKLVHP